MTLLSRRYFVQGVGISGLWFLGACGRLPGQVPATTRAPRIGFLAVSPGPLFDAFVEGLGDHGYVPSENITIERRETDVQAEGLSDFATELVALPVDVLVAANTPPAEAAKRATSTLPIVFTNVGDPVRTGLVDSFARPGSNATGLSNLTVGIASKQLELLVESVPQASRVAAMWNPANPANQLAWTEVEDGARRLGVQLQGVEARTPNDFDRAFATIEQDPPDALLLLAGLVPGPHLPRLTEFAIIHRLPTMHSFRAIAQAGGLMAYGPNLPALFRRTAYYVDRILTGTAPADLPVEQPTTFDFVINLRTARALGLTIPRHVLLQATEVIQ
jgi:putative tryptophan/tyrosine transport system substrate-binding protein